MIVVRMPRLGLTSIHRECVRAESVETGGRLLGRFVPAADGLLIQVMGLIDAGPNADSSSVHLMQDGEYQERMFRLFEVKHPEVCHIGSWHTHHVNGLTTLSSGDIETYKRTVNHEKHYGDYFYALLVTELSDRLHLRHYLFRRGQQMHQELPIASIHVVESSMLLTQRLQRK